MRARKTAGILGGMGPRATIAFCQTILDHTPAKTETDNLHLVIDNNPHMPSRTRHLLFGEQSPFDNLLTGCERLQRYPVDFIAIPCNSAAVFVPDLQQKIDIPILDIRQVTVDAMRLAHPAIRRVAALGGEGIYARRSYQDFLAAHGIQLIDHGSIIQRAISELIELIKLGDTRASHIAVLQQAIGRIRAEHGAEAVILACTEFACLPSFSTEIPVIDSSTELAKHVVAVAGSGAPIGST